MRKQVKTGIWSENQIEAKIERNANKKQIHCQMAYDRELLLLLYNKHDVWILNGVPSKMFKVKMLLIHSLLLHPYLLKVVKFTLNFDRKTNVYALDLKWCIFGLRTMSCTNCTL